jgi:hypothetical protein
MIKNQQVATLKVLYEETPQKPGESFVQIRQWETAVGDNSELIVEYGQLDLFGDLHTECQVMPFHMSIREILTNLSF